MLDLVKKKIVPACISYIKEICETGVAKNALSIPATLEQELASKLSSLTETIYREAAILEEKVSAAQVQNEGLPMARFYRDEIFSQMQKLRAVVDETETNMSEKYWPLPSYTKLLFSV